MTKQLAEGNFSVAIGGDADFVEELSMDEEGEAWRRPEATMLQLERQRAETQATRGDVEKRRESAAQVLCVRVRIYIYHIYVYIYVYMYI